MMTYLLTYGFETAIGIDGGPVRAWVLCSFFSSTVIPTGRRERRLCNDGRHEQDGW